MKEAKIISIGSMWEEYPWEVHYDEEVGDCSSTFIPCPHCHSKREKVHTTWDKTTYSSTVWTCPRVVVAMNEGNFASTGVCMDCIIAEAAKL
jgi:hypothetical protein